MKRSTLLVFGVVLLACKRESPAPAASAGRPAVPDAQPAPSAPPAPVPSSRPALPSVALDGGSWTAGIVRQQRPTAGVALLNAVRAARHEELDRVVFEFQGTAISGYHIEYIDKPVRRCGSGDVALLEGDGWLAVTFEPAAAHDEAGHALLTAREQRPGLPIVREIELTCDFEAQVTIVLGVASPNRFRVTELASPPRLVIDVRHR